MAAKAKNREFQLDGFNDTDATAAFLDVSPSYLNKARLSGGGPEFVKFGKAVKYFGRKAVDWAHSRARRSTSDVGGKAA